MKFFDSPWWRTGWGGMGLAALLLAGCFTPSGFKVWTGANAPAVDITTDVLRPNDLVTVIFGGVLDPPARHEERITEDGFITLYLIGAIKAAGKNPGQLQEEIRKRYVPQYYRESLTVTVAAENRYFFVSGEVRDDSRQVYMGGMTVLKAIAAAKGFTDFAKKKQVHLTRPNGEKWIVNAEKARLDPAKDPPVYPGDTIYVPRRHF